MNTFISLSLLIIADIAAQPLHNLFQSRRNSKAGLVIHVPMRMPSYDDMKKVFVFPPPLPMPMVVQWVNNKPVTLSVPERPVTTTTEASNEPAVFDMSFVQKPFDDISQQENLLSDIESSVLNQVHQSGEHEEITLSQQEILPVDDIVTNEQTKQGEPGLEQINQSETSTEETISTELNLSSGVVPDKVNVIPSLNVVTFNDQAQNEEFNEEVSAIDSEFIPVGLIQDPVITTLTPLAEPTDLTVQDDIEGSGAPIEEKITRLKRSIEENEIIDVAQSQTFITNDVKETGEQNSTAVTSDSNVESRQYYGNRRPMQYYRKPVYNQYYGQHPGFGKRVGEYCYGFYCQLKSFMNYLLF